MKRLLALILITITLFSLFACGASDSEAPDPLGQPDGVKPDNEQKEEKPDTTPTDPSDETEKPEQNDPNQNEEEEQPEKPQPDASLVQSGSFKGEGDIALYLYVEWSAVQKKTDQEATVTVDVYLQHYRLSVKSRSGNTVTVNDQVHTFSTDPIVCEENVQTRTKLTSYTVSVPRAADQKVSVDIDAVWKFSGVLSGEFVDKIQAVSTVELG